MESNRILVEFIVKNQVVGKAFTYLKPEQKKKPGRPAKSQGLQLKNDQSIGSEQNLNIKNSVKKHHAFSSSEEEQFEQQKIVRSSKGKLILDSNSQSHQSQESEIDYSENNLQIQPSKQKKKLLVEEDFEEEYELENNFENFGIVDEDDLYGTEQENEESEIISEKEESDLLQPKDQSKMTKRQLASLNLESTTEQLLSLPDKKNKVKKKLLTQEERQKKEEIEKKRKQQLQKQQEEQKHQTVQRILNETGKKQQQRIEKELKQKQSKSNFVFRSLPENEPSIKFVSSKEKGEQLFVKKMLGSQYIDEIAIGVNLHIRSQPRNKCSQCHLKEYKYKIPQSNNQFACSLECYKKIQYNCEKFKLNV